MKCPSWYCSPECQTRHYKVHKVDCVTSHMECLIWPDGSKFCRPTPALVQRPRNYLSTHKPTNPLVLASSPPHNPKGSDGRGMCEREQKLMKVLNCAEGVDHGIGSLDMKRNELKSVIEELITNEDITREVTTCLCQHMACLETIVNAVRKEMEHINMELNLKCKTQELAGLQTLNRNFRNKLENPEETEYDVDQCRKNDVLETDLFEKYQQSNKVEIKTGKKKEPNSTEQKIWIKDKLEKIACLASKMNEEKLKILEQLQYLQNSLIEELEMNCQEHFTDNGELRVSVLEKQKDLQVSK